jgi:hypothetical protein
LSERKYDHLFTWDVHYQSAYPPKKAMMFYGLDDDKNHFQIRFTHVSSPFEGIEPAHKHEFDEVFCFVPCSDDLTDFDGECELHLGDDGEKYIINKPCMVHVPAGLMHCPIRHTRVGLPYFFVNCVLSGEYSRPEDGREASKDIDLPRYIKKR